MSDAQKYRNGPQTAMRRPKRANADNTDKNAASRMDAGVVGGRPARTLRIIRALVARRANFAGGRLRERGTTLFCAAPIRPAARVMR